MKVNDKVEIKNSIELELPFPLNMEGEVGTIVECFGNTFYGEMFGVQFDDGTYNRYFTNELIPLQD
jgi:hypothetical protein